MFEALLQLQGSVPEGVDIGPRFLHFERDPMRLPIRDHAEILAPARKTMPSDVFQAGLGEAERLSAVDVKDLDLRAMHRNIVRV